MLVWSRYREVRFLHSPGPMKILLAIDESPCSEAAVEAVLRQFPARQSDVHVLHVDEWPKGMPMSLAFSEGPGMPQAIFCPRTTRSAGAARSWCPVPRLDWRPRVFRSKLRCDEGDARKEILDCAAGWHPDVIVLGSHGRSGLDRFLLGSVSENVMRHATCSVEVVRAAAPEKAD